MHELSVALDIVDVAAAEAERHGGGRVTAVHLRLGALSGVVRGPLVSAFELAREGTPLAGAELVVEVVPAAARCPACAADHDPGPTAQLVCPRCGGPTPELVRGRELEVVALEIDG